jgi:hypothetical protein
MVREDAPGLGLHRFEVGPKLFGLRRQVPEIGPLVEDVVGLPEHGPRAARIGKRGICPNAFQQRQGRPDGASARWTRSQHRPLSETLRMP